MNADPYHRHVAVALSVDAELVLTRVGWAVARFGVTPGARPDQIPAVIDLLRAELVRAAA